MTTIEAPTTATLHVETVALGSPNRRRRRIVVVALVFACALAVVAALVIARVRSAAGVAYVTAPVTRSTLVQSVTATGTVNPQNTIAVGTQESGTVSAIAVDFNSKVKRGQVLAKLDPTTFQAALDQAEAALAQAQAQADSAQATASGGVSGIGSAQANARVATATAASSAATAQAERTAVAAAQTNVVKSQAALALAQATMNRDTQLLGQGYIAQSQADTDRSNLVAAQTALDAARAAVSQARLTAQAGTSQAQASQAQIAAQSYAIGSAADLAANEADAARASSAAVAGAEAQVRTAELNVQKTVITSPVDGTVVARDVSVGTTVAASLQTPTLFSIAQNLQKMEVDLSVGEPDIGNVKNGDAVDFSVLAYPNRTFHGVVSQVRINPVTTSNVVTYTTVVTVDNRDGSLLPGMTANASIAVATQPNALVVPVAALQYQPPFTGAHARGTHAAAGAASPWGSIGTGASAPVAAGAKGRIFVVRAGKLARIPVTIELVNGTDAAVAPASGTLDTSDVTAIGDSSARSTASRNATAPRNPLAGVGGSGGFGGGPGR